MEDITYKTNGVCSSAIHFMRLGDKIGTDRIVNMPRRGYYWDMSAPDEKDTDEDDAIHGLD